MAKNTTKKPKQVETLTHDEAKRKNIPTAELQSAAQRAEEIDPFEPVTYQRTNPLAKGETRPRDEDLDPQIVWKGATLRLNEEQINQLATTGKLEIGDAELVWRGKDQQDWSDLIVQAPPLYIQEKIHPKAIIDDLKRQTKEREDDDSDTFDLFGDFNGIDPEAKTEFYQHDQHWSNRMILGDSLQVMASLAEREGLRGKVQCIYFDPPYGIKFNSNWQVSTQSREVKDGKQEDIAREPEVVKAFRDTWKDGIHSYLTYLRDRLTVMRDLLTESGSIFIQISDENVHRVRALMDEIFGEECFILEIFQQKKGSQKSSIIDPINDYIIWYAKSPRHQGKIKFRKQFEARPFSSENMEGFKIHDASGNEISFAEFTELTASEKKNYSITRSDPLTSGGHRVNQSLPFKFQDKNFEPKTGNSWKATARSVDGSFSGMDRLAAADRLVVGGVTYYYKRHFSDWAYKEISNLWTGFGGASNPVYVVQTNESIVARIIQMTTDPGDLVLDPTCGSGTTATVAEQWGRRWITIDTSRVSLALARARLMGARYPYYLLSDSPEGKKKEQAVTGRIMPETETHGDVRQGFVYERAPHIMLNTIANNAEIDVIWEEFRTKIEPLLRELNQALGTEWKEWQVPLQPEENWTSDVIGIHDNLLKHRTARQQAIDKSIEQKADVELLYDRPYQDNSKVRVAGPFTVESLSPHRVVPADEEELIDILDAADGKRQREDAPLNDFTQMVIDNLKSAGVHQAAKDDRITFTTIEGWPGTFIAADGRYMEGENEKRAAIFIGPEFGSVTRADITAAAREALDARFDALIACGFNFDAHSSELNKLGPLPILKAKMNPDLHMSDELKNTGAGNLFVVFGEPDIEWEFDEDGKIVVEVLGVDVFDPKSGEVRASGKDDIAAWFIDTDYNEESFFVRHAYFMGANDPYKSLKTALKAEIDKEAWETLYRDKSRPFSRPTSGRFAVKVINHFGDEVMKVFGV